MSAMKRMVTLLVLTLTSSVLTLGANVSLGLDCEHLNKTLPAKHLNQVGLVLVLINNSLLYWY